MRDTTDPDNLDVIVVGAGLSGIGAACLMAEKRPDDRFAVLEAREAMGGTWDYFRYPGIRSDSDMHTLGYSFRPWLGEKAITDGPSINTYIRETAAAYGVDECIRYRHRVAAADWDGARWQLTVETPEGTQRLSARFLMICTGYYDYAGGHAPVFAGQEDFAGPIIHPQHWPEDLDWTGKRVAVIGSGATAVTLVPELAKTAAHVTQIQRTPTYVTDMPARDGMARFFSRVLPEQSAHTVTRWKNILMGMGFFQLSQRWPSLVRGMLAKNVVKKSGADPTHFDAPYKPWDQRLCLAPDGDFFEVLRNGSASITTGAVERFEPAGVRLVSGELVEADIIVTATGLRLKLAGGMKVSVGGHAVQPGSHLSYKGAMLSDVPNLVMTFGYTNASWTLKCELVLRWAIRLLDHMEKTGADIATPRPPQDASAEPAVPLTSGYIQRALEHLPKQAQARPWRIHQNYLLDLRAFRMDPIDDGTMTFVKAPADVPA